MIEPSNINWFLWNYKLKTSSKFWFVCYRTEIGPFTHCIIKLYQTLRTHKILNENALWYSNKNLIPTLSVFSHFLHEKFLTRRQFPILCSYLRIPYQYKYTVHVNTSTYTIVFTQFHTVSNMYEIVGSYPVITIFHPDLHNSKSTPREICFVKSICSFHRHRQHL